MGIGVAASWENPEARGGPRGGGEAPGVGQRDDGIRRTVDEQKTGMGLGNDILRGDVSKAKPDAPLHEAEGER